MVSDRTDSVGPDLASGGGVLRRLLMARSRAEAGNGKAPALPQPAPPTPARAAATAIGRVADRLYRLALQPVAVTPGALTLAELPELLPAPALLVILQGPGDLLGLIALCPETVGALIEIQALGRVGSQPVERRRLTRSDAMFCADFIDALMEELAREMTRIEGFESIAGYRYATYLDDPRPLALMLEDRPYRSLDFTLRLGDAEARDSRILLALPQPVPPPPPQMHDGVRQQDAAAAVRQNGPAARVRPALAPVASAAEPGDAVPAPSSLLRAMRSAEVDLIGVLCRQRMTLADLRGLSAGKLLHLPRVNLAEARLETPQGQLLALAKFGEAAGCHALRLRDPVTLAPEGAAASGGDMAQTVPTLASEPPIDDLRQPDAFRPQAKDDRLGADKAGPVLPGGDPKAAAGG